MGTWLQRDSDWEDTYIFNADGTGMLISGPEYPYTFQISGDVLTLIYGPDGEEEFLDAVRAAAEACFVDTFSGLPEEEREAYGYYEYLEWTLSDEAINFDLPIFVDAVGYLCVMGRIGSMAGASEFWAPLYPFADFPAMRAQWANATPRRFPGISTQNDKKEGGSGPFF